MNVEQIRTNLKYYTGMPVLDQAHDDIEYLIKLVERYESALKEITDTYGVYGPHENYSYQMNEIAEEALKDETK